MRGKPKTTGVPTGSSRRERGCGSIFKPKFRDRKSGLRRECPHFRIAYYRGGQRFVENTHSDKVIVAKELLRKRLGAISLGSFTLPVNERVSIAELMEALFRDYAIRANSHVGSDGDPDVQRILKKAERRLRFIRGRWQNHLKLFFGRIRATTLSTDDINRYVQERQREASNATVNRELALLKRALNLATECTPKKLNAVPIFPRKLKENPPKDGFVTEAEYQRLIDACGEHWLKTFIVMAYTFGFR